MKVPTILFFGQTFQGIDQQTVAIQIFCGNRCQPEKSPRSLELLRPYLQPLLSRPAASAQRQVPVTLTASSLGTWPGTVGAKNGGFFHVFP